ncbi:MAG: hypothetical protein ACKPKO_22125, partial [Candidatus Fonsibacter sp.]
KTLYLQKRKISRPRRLCERVRFACRAKLYRLKNDGMDLHAYYNYMKNIKDEFGFNYDIIVAEFINKWF